MYPPKLVPDVLKVRKMILNPLNTLDTHKFMKLFILGLLLSLNFLAFLPASQSEESLPYQQEHFVGSHGPDPLKQEDLLPFLSGQHIVIVLEQPDDFKQGRIRGFLENPPSEFPEVDTLQILSSSGEDTTYAIGYIQDAELKSEAIREFEFYLVTFKENLPLERLLRILNDLVKTPGFDFVLPVFFLPDKMAAPFIQFEVEFLSPEFIPGGIDRIKQINKANFVKETQQADTFSGPVVLQLEKGAPTNVLATVLRYQQMPWIVKSAKLRWLRLRAPVEVRTKVEPLAGINSFNIWEPIQFRMYIKRDPDVELLPKALSEAAVYSWIFESTRLPNELIQVDSIEKKTQNLKDGRVLEIVSFVFRLSKAGNYVFSPYPLQIAYQELNNQKHIKVFQSGTPAAITIPNHLPRRLSQIPGHIISLTPQEVPSWIPLTGITLGILLMVAGLTWTFKLSGRSLNLRGKGLERSSDSAEQTLEALILKYQGRLKEAQSTLESLTFQGNMEPERIWLRFLSVFLKELLGEWYYQDPTHFLGGLGTSSRSIKQYMLATSRQPLDLTQDKALNLDKSPVLEVLNLLQTLEQQMFKKSLPLSKGDAEDILARAETITNRILS